MWHTVGEEGLDVHNERKVWGSPMAGVADSNPAAFNPVDYPESYHVPMVVGDAGAWVEHVPFAFSLVRMLAPRVVVELGTQWGDSFFAFCQSAIFHQFETRCFAVDTWQGDAHTGKYSDNIYNFVLSGIEQLGARATLLGKTFDEALKDFADGSIDLLHIDGLHTYEAVSHDFRSWLPKMSGRGVVLFHDTRERFGDFGVWKLWAEVSGKYPSYEFPHAHGLGVLAVGNEAPEKLRQFLNTANACPEAVNYHFGRIGYGAKILSSYMQLVRRVLHGQNILNQYRNMTGQAGEPGSLDPTQDPTAVGNRIAQEITQLVKENLALRGKPVR